MRNLTKGEYYYHKRWMANNPGAQGRANKKWKRAKDKEQWEEIGKIFELKCHFCGKPDPTMKQKVAFHQIEGKIHNYDKVYKLKYILEHPSEFVPLCRKHHRRVHQLMKWGFSWEQINGCSIERVKDYLFPSSLNP